MPHPERIVTPALLPIFRLWVIGSVLLVAISPTDIPGSYRLYLALVYALLFFYPIFSRRHDRIASAKPVDYTAISLGWIIVLLVIQFVSTSIATQFYTGSSFTTSFIGALSGENTYSAYQAYFAEEQFAFKLPVTRAGYVALLSISKVIFIFSIINFFLSKIRCRIDSIIFLLISCITYIGFGLARGTFFEVFEVASAIVFFWFMTSARRDGQRIRRVKTVIYFSAFAAIALIAMFVLNIMRRYEGGGALLKQCTQNFCYNPIGFGDIIEYPVYLLTGYFGNGGFFIASLFETTLKRGEVSYLIPMQSVLSNWGSDEFGVRAFMCERYVACRFVWTPEVATFISIFGILSVIFVNAFISYLAKFESSVIENFSVPGMILLYFAFMLAISLPSANFFTVSSPSILATAVLTGIVFWQKYRGTAAFAPKTR